MSSMQVGLKNGVVGPVRHGLGVRLDGPPEITNKAVLVVYRFRANDFRSAEQDRAAAEERFYEIHDRPESSPDLSGYSTLAAESPGERSIYSPVPQAILSPKYFTHGFSPVFCKSGSSELC